MAIYSEFSPLKMVIFHSYVSLPEGKPTMNYFVSNNLAMWQTQNRVLLVSAID